MTAIRLDRLEVHGNYRQDFDGIDELAANLDQVGLLQPIVVRPQVERDGWYWVIAGERRLRAARVLGWETIEANVREDDEREAAWVQLLENEARRNPNAMEQAAEYADQIDRHGRTIHEIAAAIGRKDNYVRDRLALLDLSPSVQAAVRSGALPQSQALAVRDLDHNRQQIAVRDFANNPSWTAERFATRLDELRAQQAAENQGGLMDEGFMQIEEYVIEDVSLKRKIGAIGMARILERIHAEVELPAGIVPLVEKAIDDHLGEKATARRAAAHTAWETMRNEKQEKAG